MSLQLPGVGPVMMSGTKEMSDSSVSAFSLVLLEQAREHSTIATTNPYPQHRFKPVMRSAILHIIIEPRLQTHHPGEGRPMQACCNRTLDW